MKKTIFVLVLVLLPTIVFAWDTKVKGHWKDTDHDGVKDTYVDPYYRTAPNQTKDDNYSTYPNVNPYSGKQGTQKDNDYYDNNSGYGNKRQKSKW